MCLTESKFNIYSDSNKSNLLETIDLQKGQKKVILEPLPAEIGVNVANTDLPFIMKIEVLGECWPMGGIVFMTLSVEERDKWYKGNLPLLLDFFLK